VRKAVDLSPLAERTGRLRQSDVQRSLDFKGIEAMARPPDCIVLLDATDLHQEATAQNIPVVGVVDSDSVRACTRVPPPLFSSFPWRPSLRAPRLSAAPPIQPLARHISNARGLA
jgi:hypothetical protein